MSLSDTGNELVGAATRAAPPLAVVGATLGGLALQDWVLIATLVYTLLQIVLLVQRFLKGRTDGS